MTLADVKQAIGIKPYFEEECGLIYCADCLDILPRIPDKSIDLVLTDPPYGINANKMTLGSGNHRFYRGNNWDSTKANGRQFGEMFRIGVNTCIWGGNYYTDILEPHNKWLIWHKKNDGLSFSEAEMAWTNYAKNVRVYSKYTADRVKSHPTEKPIEIMDWCISLAPQADLILDPFLGSGTTAVAAKQLGRKYVGIEISEKYCQIAVQRLQQGILI